jgi:DNA-binding NarL/FixJ family response regulator
MLSVMTKQQRSVGAQATPAPSQKKSCRIVIIDDHPLVRDGLAGLLTTQGFVIAGSAASAGDGLDVLRREKPDLAILDMSLAKADGLELLKQIKAEMPNMPMLVVSMHDETVYAERVLRAGARGYVMKKEPSEKIIGAITAVLNGEIAVSDRVKQEMLTMTVTGKRSTETEASIIDRLSDRELQVFQFLGEGIPTREIAERLHLSVKTIESYRENLKTKLNLPNGAALVQRAIQWHRFTSAAS